MKGRDFTSDRYRYGFNGMEKDDEIAGKGNHNTALFWEYDTRLGRRWNRDRVVKHHESPYACFANNTIWFVDANGSDSSLTGRDNTWRFDVEKGDTYSSISKRTGVSVENLRKWNKYEDIKIPIGAQLNISDPTTKKSDTYATLNLEGAAKINIEYLSPAWTMSDDPYIGNAEIYGPLLTMTYKNPNKGSIDWVQTFNTNYMLFPFEGGIAYNSPLSDIWAVDPTRPGNPPHLFREGNYFFDHPSRPVHPEGSIYWIGEASAVRWSGSSYTRLATFKYGFIIKGPDNARQIVLTFTDNASEFHLNTISNLPTQTK